MTRAAALKTAAHAKTTTICPRAACRVTMTALCAAVLLLGGACASKLPSVYQTERFDPVSYYSRGFDEPAERVCEASRRALLSQGYVVEVLRKLTLAARKSFQPSEETHVQLVFTISCAPDGNRAMDGSTLFVSALQEQYSLKKSSRSASVEVGPIGSVSLPFGGSNDALIKTGSETIPSSAFYERFFELVRHYIAHQAEPAPEPSTKLPLPRPLPAAPKAAVDSDAGRLPPGDAKTQVEGSPAKTVPAPPVAPSPAPDPPLPGPAFPGPTSPGPSRPASGPTPPS